MVGDATSRLTDLNTPRPATDGDGGDGVRIGTSLTSAYPGPLITVDRAGTIAALNEAGELVADALRDEAAGQLRALIERVAESGLAETDFVRLGEGRRTVAYELMVLPSTPGDGAFTLMARDVTMERNLRDALIESRKRYKDLVECSSDFVWETDADGRFAFVTIRGALGFPPDHLVGREARTFLDRRRPMPEPFPFEARAPHEEEEVWFRSAAGEPICLLVSCTPLVNEEGTWLGARGICRDVTEARRRDTALARARARESLLASIVKAIRDEVEPDRLLETAAAALTEGLRDATACWVMRAPEAGQLYCASSFGGIPVSVVEQRIAEAVSDQQDEAPVAEFECVDGDNGILTVMAAATNYHDRMNGALSVARFDRRAWSEEERKLLAGVADQLGIALQQIETQEELLKLSQTDGLTGLLNRRAFVEEVRGRLDAKLAGALFYVDLDNFKPVNDVFGHKKGDEVLRALADILRETRAPGDVVGRLGGDEFAMWCGVVDGGEARERAGALSRAARVLAHYSIGLDGKLDVSIGVALSGAASIEPVDALFARADAAMYQAKRKGKGTYAEAPPMLAATDREREPVAS